MTTSLTRRTAITAALATAAAPAAAAIPGPVAATGDDAELLELERQIEVNFPQLTAAQDHSDELRQLTWVRFSRWREVNGMDDLDALDAALLRIMEENGSDEATANLNTMLDRIDPLYDRAMAIRASTIRGLAVKARAAAVLSYELWGKPADEMRRSEQALRSLIEDICTMAGVSLDEVMGRSAEA